MTAPGQRKITRAFIKQRADFYIAGKRLDANPATRDQANCWLCGQRIDYDAPPGSTDQSHELDHAQPVSTHPELQHQPSNFRHSHRTCNRVRGDGTTPPNPNLGTQVPDWW